MRENIQRPVVISQADATTHDSSTKRAWETNLGCWACPRQDCAKSSHLAASRREVRKERLACLASPSEGAQAAKILERGPRPHRESTQTSGSAETAPQKKKGGGGRAQSGFALACGWPVVSATTPTAGPRPRAHARWRVAALLAEDSAGSLRPSPAGRRHPARRARSSSHSSAACVASDQMPWRW